MEALGVGMVFESVFEKVCKAVGKTALHARASVPRWGLLFLALAGSSALAGQLSIDTKLAKAYDADAGQDTALSLTPLSPSTNKYFPPLVNELKATLRRSLRFDRASEFSKELEKALGRLQDYQSGPQLALEADGGWESWDRQRIKTAWLEVLTCSIDPPWTGQGPTPDASLSFFQYVVRHQDMVDLAAKLSALARYGWLVPPFSDEFTAGLSCTTTNSAGLLQELRFTQGLSVGLVNALIEQILTPAKANHTLAAGKAAAGKAAAGKAAAGLPAAAEKSEPAKASLHEALWDESDERELKRQVTQALTAHHEAVFRSLLSSGLYSGAIAWLRGLFVSAVPLFVPGNEGAEGLTVPVVSPLLEIVLEKMVASRARMTEQYYNATCGEWCEDDKLDDFIAKFMPREPFSSGSYQQARSLREQRPSMLSPLEWQALDDYLGHGMVKSAFAKLAGEHVLAQLVRLDDEGDAVKEFVHYVNAKHELFVEFRRYGGIADLLLLERNDDTQILRQAVASRNYMAIVYLYFLDPGHGMTPDASLSNEFHLVLRGSNDTTQDESVISFILQFFLYAPRMDAHSVVKALRQKNKAGETPLSLAAKLGLSESFDMMRTFLQAEGYFEQSEHSGEEETLGAILYRGLSERIQKMGASKDASWLKKLQAVRTGGSSFKRYDANDEKARADMEKLLSELEPILAEPLQRRVDPVTRIYRPAVALIFKHFQNEALYPGFKEASVSVRLSYYEVPFRKVLARVYADFSVNFLTADVVFGYLLGEQSNTMGRFEEKAFRTMISEERAKRGG